MNIKKQVNWTEPQERFMRDAEEKLGRDWFSFLWKRQLNGMMQHLQME